MLELKTYKNWKEICSAMGWDTTGGNTKKSYLKKLESLCSYDKLGNKFVIKEIYETPKEIEDGRSNNGSNSKYAEPFEKLLKHMATTNDNYIAIIRASEIQEVFNFISLFSSEYNNDSYKISQVINVDEKIVEDLARRNNDSFNSAVHTALNNITKNSNWVAHELIEVTEVDEYGVTKTILHTGNDFLMRYERTILTYESIVMEEMGVSKKNALVYTGRYLEFLNRVCELIREETEYKNIKSYSKIYYINGKGVEDIINYKMTPEELYETLITIRQRHFESAKTDATKRELDALDIYEKSVKARGFRKGETSEERKNRLEIVKKGRSKSVQLMVNTDYANECHKVIDKVIGTGNNGKMPLWVVKNKGNK